MIRKLFVIMLIAGAAIFSTACWDYACSGAGTCSDVRTCCDGLDCYYVADGETFDCAYADCYAAAQAVTDYCYYSY